MEPFSRKDCLKVLHVRQSGWDIEEDGSWALEDDLLDLRDDFREFADWVFGVSGILSLRILAYGDFSCYGWFKDNCFFLCRARSSDSEARYHLYDPKVEKDTELENLLDKHEGFLRACPTSHPEDYA